MSEKKTATVPYYVHEGELWRLERMNNRLIAVTVVEFVILAIVGMWKRRA